MDIEKQISIFKAKIKEKYPHLTVDYSYDADEDYYHIWHTNSNLEYRSDGIHAFIGGLIRECFYANNIFNFSFGYDHKKFEEEEYLRHERQGMKEGSMNGVYAMPGKPITVKGENAKRLLKQLNDFEAKHDAEFFKALTEPPRVSFITKP